ncbi:MAG TPA: hypothetical protein V6C88_01735 [Chroococcidiopsis sp.]
MKALRWLVVGLTLVLLSALTMLNIQPYISMARQLVAMITDVPFLDFLMLIPVVSSLISLIGRIAADAFGVALWGVLQLLQVLPGIMRGDLKILDNLIRGVNNIVPQVIKETDSEVLQELKEDYNQAPKKWLKRAATLAIVAYLVDTVLCFLRFPPYQGGVLGFWDDVQLGVQSLDSVDWANLTSAIATLFGFELILTFAIWIAQGLALFNRRRAIVTPPPSDEHGEQGNHDTRARRARRVYQN